MKRKLCWLPALVLITLGTYGLLRPGYAQDPAKDNLRIDIAAFLSKFMDAANRADTTTLMAMISSKPDVCLIADGQIYQGTGDIQAHLEQLMGQRGKYLIQLGTMNIVNDNGLALATGPYTMKLRGGAHAALFQGAVTFLLEKEGRRHWKITHLHRSTAAVNLQ